jgi:hypothetical protein
MLRSKIAIRVALVPVCAGLALASCGRDKPKPNAKTGSEKAPFAQQVDPASKPSSEASESSNSELSFTRVAVRNFQELKGSIAQVTCVSDGDALAGSKSYGQFFADVAENLPSSNAVDDYIGAHVVAAMNLASHACQLSVRLPSAARCQWSAGLRDSRDPDTAFTPENIDALGRGIFEHLWGLDPTKLGATSPFLKDLKTNVAAIRGDVQRHLAASSLTDAMKKQRTVEGVLVAVCAAALSSAPFTLY